MRIGSEEVHYADDVDQIHDVTDPVERAVQALQQRVEELERRLAGQEQLEEK